MDKICGIYYIKNLINGKYYIGQSQDIYKRWARERMYLRSDKTAWNEHLQNAWRKYGEDNFELTVLEVVDGNGRAKNLYEKVGFVEEGKNIRALKYDDGTYRDEYKMIKIL